MVQNLRWEGVRCIWRGVSVSAFLQICAAPTPPFGRALKHFAGIETVLPKADFVIEGYVDLCEPLCDEGPAKVRVANE